MLITRRRTLRGLALGVALISLAWTIDWTWRDRSYPNEKLTLRGVPNFGRVSPLLYRGGQPDATGFVGLRNLGVDAVVSFTLGEEGAKAEAANVARLGMEYVWLPWSTTQVPQPELVRTFLDYLREHPQETVFVHCKAGVDRTGVMIAIARIAIDRWPTQTAVDEMNAFHYHFLFLPHLQSFVRRFDPADYLSLGGPASD